MPRGSDWTGGLLPHELTGESQDDDPRLDQVRRRDPQTVDPLPHDRRLHYASTPPVSGIQGGNPANNQ